MTDGVSAAGRKKFRGWLVGGAAMLAIVAGGVGAYGVAHAAAAPLPMPADDEATTAKSERAVFAGGCFWGIQAVFQHVDGVTGAVSGYAGGTLADPHYGDVSTGRTGHAESVEVTFDPTRVSYGKLLQIFFSVAHDPTELNRQGPDTGTQYRSALFTENDAQQRVAAHYVAQLGESHVFGRPIVTEIKPLAIFWPAEHYHQDYATLHPDSPYIAFNDLPKVDALKTEFPDRYRAEPTLVAAGASHVED